MQRSGSTSASSVATERTAGRSQCSGAGGTGSAAYVGTVAAAGSAAVEQGTGRTSRTVCCGSVIVGCGI